ncbi:hypothetical protein LJC56_11925, partial [Christensenellaceae bacterium OttesenSCG-928-K19]|nr:hypothetical protein [Christensenellaceae bacterium OttesenSCG-928-K19]
MKFHVPRLFVLLAVTMLLIGFACPAFAVEADASLPGDEVDAAPEEDFQNELQKSQEEVDVPQVLSDSASGEEAGLEQEPGSETSPGQEFGGEAGAFFGMASAATVGAGDENTVANQEELEAWLSSHQSGTVTLTDNITLAPPQGSVYAYTILLEYPVIIDTGNFGIVFNGGSFLAFEGCGAQITGTGILRPVIDVQDMGASRFGGGRWLGNVCSLNVTAIGDGVTGGTAMRIQDDISLQSFDLSESFFDRGRICAYGKNAIGLELIRTLPIVGFDVAVEGENSTAVLAQKDAAICFSKLSATGDEAYAVRGENGAHITVDTCLAQPVPQGKNITTYTAKPDPLYYPIKQFGSQDQLIRHNFTATYLYGCSVASQGWPLDVDCNDEERMQIDLDTVGFYRVSGTISSEWFSA